MDKVSIIIPTYKRADFLDRLLKSIVGQTYQNYEVIIIDDNSPNENDYKKIVEKYSSIIKELRYVRNKINKGAPYSRNIGINMSKYELLALVDDDDEWLPMKLEKQVKLFENPKIGICYTWTNAVDESNNIVHEYKSNFSGKVLKDIIKECFIPSPSVMVTKKAIVNSGLFDESFPSCQDWDMWTRIIKNDFECDVVREVLTIYHKHGRESIGLSERAKIGYKKYYRKHFKLFIKYYLFSKEYKVLIDALLKVV